MQLKSGDRRVFVGSRLDRLYGDYVWWLCDRGADAAVEDWDEAYIFCNVFREPLFASLRVESVYAHLARMKRLVPGLPAAMTPHWFRHTHATALLTRRVASDSTAGGFSTGGVIPVASRSWDFGWCRWKW